MTATDQNLRDRFWLCIVVDSRCNDAVKYPLPTKLRRKERRNSWILQLRSRFAPHEHRCPCYGTRQEL